MSKLKNAKYEAFCNEYVVDRNGAQAAIRAGYSAKTANSKAAQLLTIVSIQERIEELEKEIQDRNKIKIDEVVQFLADTIRADASEYVENGVFGLNLRDITELPIEKRRLINSLSFKKGQSVEFKLVDKMTAAEKLMRHLGGYKEDNDQKGRIRFIIDDEEPDAEGDNGSD